MYQEEHPLLTVQQSQRLEGIRGRVHGRDERWNAREDVAPNTHGLLDIGVHGQRWPMLGFVLAVCHGRCTDTDTDSEIDLGAER